MSKKVSAVIPSYNGQALLQRQLPAVLKSLRPGDELIVVDDASTDATVDWLTKKYALALVSEKVDFRILDSVAHQGSQSVTLRLVSNQHNLRFGAAVNRGVQVASGDLIFLLNNDVKPRAEVLTHLLPHFESDQVFAVGCLEREESSHGEVITGGKNKLWFERGLFIHSRATNFKSGDTAWVSGGSGLFDRQKWLALGGFDPLFYPAYWEDIDLSFRARQRGWQVLFEARAIVEHRHETTNQDVFGQAKIDSMSWRHAQAFTWKNGNWWQRIQYLLWQPYWLWKRRGL